MKTPQGRLSPIFLLRLFQTWALLAGALLIGGLAEVRAASALSFDGVNDYVTFGAAPGLGSATFTVETWFKRTATGVTASTGTGGVSAIPLVTKGRGEGDNSNLDMNYFLGIRASDNVLCADFEEGASGAQPGLNHPVTGVTPIANNVWYHAAATYDGAKWQLFLNGVIEAELVVGRPPRADSIQHAALGSALTSTGVAAGFFAGALDEIRIWNYALTAQEIADNKNLEIQAAPGLLGRWGLNEGSGTAAADSSGSGINGTLTNGPLWVAGFDPATTTAITRGPYLQQGTPTSVIVRWRTNVATNSRVQFGTSPSALTGTVSDATATAEHQVTLTGLAPDTQYYYSAGSSTTTLATGAEFTFFTSPPIGTAHATRVWVLGDSGTKDAVAASVRNGYTSFAAGRYTDVWLMLGDDAYNSGTDSEFQAAVFDMYPTYLRQSTLWSALGNHETAQATNPPLTIPYFQIFNFPTNGEAGGVPSGTEKYYSFDYGRIHFIALDSMTSSRQPGSAMLTWLQADLESTAQDWIIAFWHHPPYTKGSHNSDTETELIQMRQNVLPLLEAGGVDLVLAGHSHCYERSYFINGHYGLSTTFSGQNLIDGGSGREDGTGTYDKPAGLAANQGAVYITAGNGGHVTSWVGGSTAEFNPTPHPAMYYSALHVGSLVLDVNGNRLEAKMIRQTGAVDDYFTIVKNVPNTPPSVSITSPAQGATFTAPATITVTANATDSDGSVAQVDFYADATLIGAATSAPFSVTWNSVAAGSYALTAAATDNLGATTLSAAVNITVNPPPPPPAPAGLNATAGDAQVALSWSASSGAASYNVKRATVSGGPYANVATGVTTTGFTDSAVTNGTTYFYVVTAMNLGGESANSNEASATPLPPPPAAPAGLNAVAGNAQVALAWNASSGAASYNVKRGTASGGSYTTLASGLSATNFTDTTASNGTTYFYVVTAVNLGGESANSNETSATPSAPLPPPLAPGGLTATAGNAQVALSWSASTGATSYSVKRATVSGGSYTTLATGLTVTSYTDASASNGTTYFSVVSASNNSGESPNSSEATATPAAPPTAPVAPTNLVANALSRTQINLAWSDNASNETGYLIERSINGTSFTQIASVGANLTSFASTGLTANKKYYYRVRATNAVGQSAYSNVATARTLK